MQPGTPTEARLRRVCLPNAPCIQNILNSVSLDVSTSERNTVCVLVEPSHVPCSEMFFPAGVHFFCLDLGYKLLKDERDSSHTCLMQSTSQKANNNQCYFFFVIQYWNNSAKFFLGNG